MKYFFFISFLTFFSCLLSSPEASGAVVSFENGIPAGWSTSKGTVSISGQKAKLGEKALCWDWQGGDILKAAKQSDIPSSSANTNGGISLWIYNSLSSQDKIIIRFKDDNSVQCSIPFNLNFIGWRCLLAEFANDMGLPKNARGTIHTLEIVAPETGSGTIFFDHLEFQNKISWERMSNFQFSVKENAGTDSYLEPRLHLSLKEAEPSQIESAGINHIRTRLLNWYTGTGDYDDNPYYKIRMNAMKAYITKGINAVPDIQPNGTVNGSGLYGHNLYGSTADGTPLITFRNISETCLLQLAYDYRLNNNQNSLEQLFSLYDWYYDQGWADGSALGTLRFEMLRSAGFHHSFMLVADKTDSRSRQLTEAIGWFSRFGDVCTVPANPGELADYMRTLALPKLFYALNQEKPGIRTSALKAYKDYMDNAMSYAHGYLGSLKEDGSGYHHRGPYFSAYYPDVLYAGCLVYYLLHDTPFAMSKESFQNLKEALLNFRFICGEYNVPGATTGRFPTQTEVMHQLLPAMAYLIESSEDQELTAAFKRLWCPDKSPVKDYISKVRTDICLSSTLGEMELLLSTAERNIEKENNPVGTRYMPYSGMLIVRNPEWMFTVKGFSKYIWDFESSATENPYGRYQSYGQLEYRDLVQDLRSYDINKNDAAGTSGWDWRLLNGTTTRYITDSELHYSANNKHRNFSDATFLGGIGFDDNNAVFTSRLHDREISGTFYADKSVFVAGNEVLCFGSDIRDSKGPDFLATTLFQHKINGNGIYMNGQEIQQSLTGVEKPEVKDNFGNHYFVHQGTVDFRKSKASWSCFINHGNNVSEPETYAYTWLIHPNQEDIEKIRRGAGWKILKQDADGHAALHQSSGLLAASIFRGNKLIDTGIIRQVNKPLLAMLRKNTETGYLLAISDPDLNRPGAANNDKLTDAIVSTPGSECEIWIELQGIFKVVNLDNSVLIEVNDGITRVTVPRAKDGKTYFIDLEENTTPLHKQTSGSGMILTRQGNIYSLVHAAGESFEWKLYTTDSIMQESGIGNMIDMSVKNKGLYLLWVKNSITENIFKITR